jgi:NMD protein affecting ribosome stability and mRNA decay
MMKSFAVPKGAVMCSDCGAVFWKKLWRHSLELARAAAGKVEKRSIIFRICPACDMARKKLFEGEITLLNLPGEIAAAARRIAENTGLEAYRRDPLDRILAIVESPGILRITTSENQLAQKIAKKLKSVFHVDYNPKFSREESLIRITMDLSALAERKR